MSPQRQPTREAGLCPVCGDSSASKFGVYCTEHKEASARPPLEEWFTPQIAEPAAADGGDTGGGAGDAGPFDIPGPEPTGAGEAPPSSPHGHAPAPPRPSMGTGGAGRLRRLLGLKPKGDTEGPAGAAPPRERAPRRPRPRAPFSMRNRLSTADDATEIYGQIAGRLELTRHYPAGRMMMWQAPMFGVVFDTAIAGTFVDRLAAQPMMRQKAKWEPLADLVLPPVLLVGMKNALDAGNMNAFNAMAPILEYSIDRHLLSIAPAAAEARALREQKEAVVAEAFPDLAGQEIDGRPLSPAQTLIATLFAEPQWAADRPPPGDGHTEEASQNGKTVRPGADADPQGSVGV